MKSLLKRIADLILVFVAILGLIGSFRQEINFDITDLLIFTAIILFISFVALIIHHVSKLEERIIIIQDKFINGRELEDVRQEMEELKRRCK